MMMAVRSKWENNEQEKNRGNERCGAWCAVGGNSSGADYGGFSGVAPVLFDRRWPAMGKEQRGKGAVMRDRREGESK
ncbi:hypothetical protein HAX54_044267 [Datura stramonium]|uniref:Uncharacterized protein n=1 Tax=Datura stramonium TaxID=4076 RepID=A0ABS8Y6F5_DATST|nr:hypothetical protein [Datura stramonium]